MADEDLFRVLALVNDRAGVRIEPSAAAAFLGVQEPCTATATHLFWTTGGAFVPAEDFAAFLARGRRAAEQAGPWQAHSDQGRDIRE